MRIYCACLLVLCAGCSKSSDRDADLAGAYAPLLGDLPVAISVPPSAPTDTARAEDPSLEIGLEDGADEYLLQDVVDIEVSDLTGTVYVADAGRLEVLAYGPDGVHLKTFSARGQGPGELMGLSSIDLLGDTLLIMDPVQARVTLFDTAGSLISTLPVDETGGFRGSRLGQTVRKAVVHQGALYSFHRSDPIRTQANTQRGYLIRRVLSTGIMDTVISVPVVPIRGQARNLNGGQSFSYEAPPLFTPEVHWDIAEKEGLLYLAGGGSYDVYAIAVQSDSVLRQLTRDSPQRRVTRRDRVALLEYEMGRSDQGIPPGFKAAAIEPLVRGRFARIKPTVSGIIAAGPHVWVNLFSTAGDPTGNGARWDVVALDGKLNMTVLFPAGFRLFTVEGDDLYGVKEDDGGVQRVVAFNRYSMSGRKASHAP